MPRSAMWTAMVADSALLGTSVDMPAVLSAHLSRRDTPYAWALGPLLVPDTLLAAVDRAMAEHDPLAVTVVNTSGAGGLPALAGRTVRHLDVRAVLTSLRDLDDLTGNAARVVAAAQALPSEVTVQVVLPRHRGWQSAARVVEEAGLEAAIRLGETASEVAAAAEVIAQLRLLVELDLPFSTVGGMRRCWPHPDHDGATQYGIWPVLAALRAIIDGADDTEGHHLLTTATPQTVTPITEGTAPRLRRRWRGLATDDVPGVIADLTAAGDLADDALSGS